VSSFFADIFRNNALNNGLLPVTISDQMLAAIFKATEVDPSAELKIDLQAQTIELVGSDFKESFDIAPYKKECLANGYDDVDFLVSIRSEIEAFEQNMGRLIEFCLERTPHVIVAGTFWRNERYERILAASAERYGLEYVDLGWITLLNDIYPKVGDTLYDIEGKPYTITKDIIIGHPNDKGMRLIAHSLMRAIKYLAR
jgi:hypothetical protein